MDNYYNTLPQTTGIIFQQNQAIQGAPRESNVSERAKELLGYLHELDAVQAATREKLLGPSPQAQGTQPTPGEPSIEQLVAMACQRAACILVEAKSIHGRL